MAEVLNPTKLLFDLHRGTEIAETFSGCLEPEVIALRVTNGIVERFDCAFARIWLLEPDRTYLKLVASSGMYTRTDGRFAKVPIGAYKVGKIAQNRVSFLSNNLADETWVGDRQWAIANNILGFAGYPLEIKGRVVGVLAAFSHHKMPPEFLEFLRMLCTIAAIAIDSAFKHQQEKQSWQALDRHPWQERTALSDRLADILHSHRLTLVGTERSLDLTLEYVFLRTAEILNKIGGAYCRLIYADTAISLEAIVATPTTQNAIHNHPHNYPHNHLQTWLRSLFHELFVIISSLGGTIDIHSTELQIAITIPFVKEANPLSERELEMMQLLTQGLRDRDIAQQLIISESTVKFHINNILAKLKARTRFQALHLAMVNGWLQ
ncbi:LuxR C-terminal-related transcriptional regulator [Pseudanabaena sp. UWO310]|uniref:LuxR C-terminal-related transcriptional regulator n=1 Tax=Pseudanabaena sp. UWO310 TaxID=2480795 RepID=UPI0011573EE6|nr:LuxR C-terminal-related transcriptional regulator [Pseudanabaena sp. UWO310]TYQ30800.1 GAF domain-containing protein [Pseudanabaena sp. UWO310]